MLLPLSDLVLEVESMSAGARVFVSKCALADEEDGDDTVRDSVPHHQGQNEGLDDKVDDVAESGKL